MSAELITLDDNVMSYNQIMANKLINEGFNEFAARVDPYTITSAWLRTQPANRLMDLADKLKKLSAQNKNIKISCDILRDEVNDAILFNQIEEWVESRRCGTDPAKFYKEMMIETAYNLTAGKVSILIGTTGITGDQLYEKLNYD